MAYIRIGENESTLGSLGCGPGCLCKSCRIGGSNFGEWYVPEEEEETPPPAATPKGRTAPPASNLSGWGRFGQLLPRRRVSLTSGLSLRMPAFETITGFARDGASLSAAQLERVSRVADFVAQSWRGTAPITSIRITGYIDANEWQSDLGQRRAVAVRDALLRSLSSAPPGPATRHRCTFTGSGLSTIASVDIYI